MPVLLHKEFVSCLPCMLPFLWLKYFCCTQSLNFTAMTRSFPTFTAQKIYFLRSYKSSRSNEINNNRAKGTRKENEALLTQILPNALIRSKCRQVKLIRHLSSSLDGLSGLQWLWPNKELSVIVVTMNSATGSETLLKTQRQDLKPKHIVMMGSGAHVYSQFARQDRSQPKVSLEKCADGKCVWEMHTSFKYCILYI